MATHHYHQYASSGHELDQHKRTSKKYERVKAAIQADPGATNAAIARACETSRDTVRRVRHALTPPAAPVGSVS